MIDFVMIPAAIGLVVWLVAAFARDYSATPGTVWHRLLAAGKGSATMLWARFKIVVGALTAALIWGADFIGHPEFDAPIKTLLRPEWVPAYLVVVGFVTLLARKRTL